LRLLGHVGDFRHPAQKQIAESLSAGGRIHIALDVDDLLGGGDDRRHRLLTMGEEFLGVGRLIVLQVVDELQQLVGVAFGHAITLLDRLLGGLLGFRFGLGLGFLLRGRFGLVGFGLVFVGGGLRRLLGGGVIGGGERRKGEAGEAAKTQGAKDVHVGIL
jgi:hypothetical protein